MFIRIGAMLKLQSEPRHLLADVIATNNVLIAKIQAAVADNRVSPHFASVRPLRGLRLQGKPADFFPAIGRCHSQYAVAAAFFQAIQHAVGKSHRTLG